MSSLAAREASAPARPRHPLGIRGDLAVAALLALAALALAWHAGVKNAAVVPDVLRVVIAGGLLCTAAGYAPTRLLLPREMRPHMVLAVPVVGAMTASLGLTVLGFLHVPLAISLAVVILAGGAAALVVRRRHGPLRAEAEDLAQAGPARRRVAWPLFIAALIVAITLLPMLRAGFATTIGQNGDAAVTVGTAEFLRHAPPRGEHISGWVDRMPANWRSKYPIYYALAGTSELSGLEATRVLSTVMSLMLAMTAAGFFLLAYHALRAGWLASLGVMALVPLDRILTYLTVQPFFNQIWGVFALSLILAFGLLHLRSPTRGSAALFLGFLALGGFAYPLMLPIPVLLLGTAATIAWRRDRARGRRPGWIAALGLPRPPRTRAATIAVAVLAAPFVLVALAGVVEKGYAAALVVLPGSDLSGWNALPSYLPFHKFFGLVDPLGIGWLTAGLVIAAAAYGCARAVPREVGVPFAVTLGAGLLVGAYFKARTMGAFFYFKDLSFIGPLMTTMAVVGLGAMVHQRRRVLSVAGVALLGLLVVNSAEGTRREALDAAPQLTRDLLGVRTWSEQLPANASVLIDLPQDGEQLWAGYVLARHPVSGTDPYVSTTFPYPPAGTKADYLLQHSMVPPPPRGEVVGSEPIRRNASFRLWKMRPGLPGRDVSSRRSLDEFSSVLSRP